MFCNGSYFQSAAPTTTPIPTATPKPGVPTNTPLMTWTPTPHSTTKPSPTPPCSGLGVRIRMPQKFFTPGSVCSCEMFICNPGPGSIADAPVFAILEIADNYYFAPGFNAFDYYSLNLAEGWSNIIVLDEFVWPDSCGSYAQANWFAAMTDANITRIMGTMDIFSFSWSE